MTVVHPFVPPAVAPDIDLDALKRQVDDVLGRASRSKLAALARRPDAAATEFASPLATLAGALRRQSRHAEADAVRTRIAALEAALLSAPPTLDVATALECLADYHQQHEEPDQAEALLRAAADIREQALPLGRPALAATLERMIALLRAQGRAGDAAPHVAHLVALRRAALAPDDPATALAQRMARFGPDHPAVALTAYALAELHRAEGHHELEAALHRRALIIRVNALGPDHLDVADSLEALAACYRRDGRRRQASDLSSRAHAIRTAHAGAQSSKRKRSAPDPSDTPGPAC